MNDSGRTKVPEPMGSKGEAEIGTSSNSKIHNKRSAPSSNACVSAVKAWGESGTFFP